MEKEGKTLIDLLNEIYAKFGPFKEKQLSVHFGDGMQGVKKMNELMEALRAHPPKEICGQEVVIIDDYLTLEKKNLATNANEKLLLPTSNVLVLRLTDESKFVIRPSGTEPKIKIYGLARSDNEAHLDKCLKMLKERYLS